MDTTDTMDTQLTELIGRNWLVNELLRAGLEVATPLRDRGIDLIAYFDLEGGPQAAGVHGALARFAARPIQMKAVTGKRFTVNAKYAKFPDLLVVHIWHVEDPARTLAYGLTYPEMYALAEARGWTATPTWKQHGLYNVPSPSKQLTTLLQPYVMTAERWRLLVRQGPQTAISE
jgi:hypothetical protein